MGIMEVLGRIAGEDVASGNGSEKKLERVIPVTAVTIREEKRESGAEIETKAKVYPEHPLTVAYKGRPEVKSWVVAERCEDGILEDGTIEKDVIIVAEKAFSRTLNSYLWILRDPDFRPGDGLALYYKDELAVFEKKTLTELRWAQELKLIFPGCRVVELNEPIDGSETE